MDEAISSFYIDLKYRARLIACKLFRPSGYVQDKNHKLLLTSRYMDASQKIGLLASEYFVFPDLLNLLLKRTRQLLKLQGSMYIFPSSTKCFVPRFAFGFYRRETHHSPVSIPLSARNLSYLNTAPSSTCAPSAQSSGLQYSVGVCDSPSFVGVNIIPVGHLRLV